MSQIFYQRNQREKKDAISEKQKNDSYGKIKEHQQSLRRERLRECSYCFS